MAAEKVYDVLVFGAGPAGAASALFASDRGLKTAVVDRGSPIAERSQLEWFHPQGADLLAKCGVDHREAVLDSIESVRFVDAACAHEVRAAIGKKIEIVDSARLTEGMLARAAANGAEVLSGQVTAVRTKEKTASLIMQDGGHFTGKVLIAADGSRSLACRSFGLERELETARRTVCCQAVVDQRGPKKRGGERTAAELTLLLASEDFSAFGYCFVAGDAKIIGLVAPAALGDVRAEYAGAVSRWKDGGVLPADVDPARLTPQVREVPRGLALDYDTHVGKNALFVGDAGGYVAAVSHEGLYPAIWSASLAVDVCGIALGSTHAQDALTSFDSRWRGEMADYLRPPNSDLRFLLPLIFSNQRMAEKLVQAFFFGTNF
jgi:flavin-dependent dehydrogenase